MHPRLDPVLHAILAFGVGHAAAGHGVGYPYSACVFLHYVPGIGLDAGLDVLPAADHDCYGLDPSLDLYCHPVLADAVSLSVVLYGECNLGTAHSDLGRRVGACTVAERSAVCLYVLCPETGVPRLDDCRGKKGTPHRVALAGRCSRVSVACVLVLWHRHITGQAHQIGIFLPCQGRGQTRNQNAAFTSF